MSLHPQQVLCALQALLEICFNVVLSELSRTCKWRKYPEKLGPCEQPGMFPLSQHCYQTNYQSVAQSHLMKRANTESHIQFTTCASKIFVCVIIIAILVIVVIITAFINIIVTIINSIILIDVFF